MIGLMPTIKQQYNDVNGNPLTGGLLYSYIAGTTIPTDTYTNLSGITANTNPIVLDARGEADVWLSSAFSYKFKLAFSDGTEIWTVDNVNVTSGGGGSSVDELVKVNSGDLVSAYLSDKLIAAAGVTLTLVDTAGVITMEASFNGVTAPYINSTSGLTATTINAAIDEVDAQVDTNVTNITTNTTNIATNASDIATNTTNIATNTTNIASNATNIATNTTDIATNTTSIATNTTNIATNATNIATNDTDIAANTTNIATNTTNIASNDTDISNNATNIATNTTNIATNTTNIATNVTAIGTNTTNIATNATAITANTTLANSKVASVSGGTNVTITGTATNPIINSTSVTPAISLQDAYDDSTTPEITTDATRGAVSIKRGSALDTDNVFEVQDGTGANTFEVTGEGFTSAIVFNVLNGGQLRLNGAGTSAISLNDDGTNKGVIYATETYLYLSHPTEVLIGGTTAKVSGNLDVTGTRADVNILESSGTATFGGLVTAVADMDVGNNLDVTGLTSLDGDATFDRNSTTFDVMGMSTDLNLSNLNTAITVGHYVTASTPTGLPTGWGGRIDLTITGAIVYRKQVVVNYDASPAVDFGKTMSRVTTTATNPTPTWTDWKEVVTSDVDGNIFIEDNTTGSTVAGNLWRDGNNLKFRDASVTKNLTHNASSLVSTPTLTVDIGLYTQFSLRSISDPTVTIAAPTNGGSALGPSHDGQKLTLRFRDNNTSRTLSWNAIFRAIGVTLPLSTTAFKTLYVGCIYHGAEGKWDVVAVSEEA